MNQLRNQLDTVTKQRDMFKMKCERLEDENARQKSRIADLERQLAALQGMEPEAHLVRTPVESPHPPPAMPDIIAETPEGKRIKGAGKDKKKKKGRGHRSRTSVVGSDFSGSLDSSSLQPSRTDSPLFIRIDTSTGSDDRLIGLSESTKAMAKQQELQRQATMRQESFPKAAVPREGSAATGAPTTTDRARPEQKPTKEHKKRKKAGEGGAGSSVHKVAAPSASKPEVAGSVVGKIDTGPEATASAIALVTRVEQPAADEEHKEEEAVTELWKDVGADMRKEMMQKRAEEKFAAKEAAKEAARKEATPFKKTASGEAVEEAAAEEVVEGEPGGVYLLEAVEEEGEGEGAGEEGKAIDVEGKMSKEERRKQRKLMRQTTERGAEVEEEGESGGEEYIDDEIKITVEKTKAKKSKEVQ